MCTEHCGSWLVGSAPPSRHNPRGRSQPWYSEPINETSGFGLKHQDEVVS